MADTVFRSPRFAAAVRRPASARQRARTGGLFAAGHRWMRVALLVAAVVVGLPLAHAMFGEIAAMLGGAALLGFLVGRWTAPQRR